MSRYATALVSSLLLAVASGPGCKAAQVASHAVVDCLVADRAKIDATIVDLGGKTKPDGTHDWAAIEADAISAGVVIGGCALAELVESYLTPSQSIGAPNEPVKPPSDSAEARHTLEEFRTTRAGNATFKTRLGTL